MRYPSPALLTRNSPAITPTSDRPMFTFSELNSVPKFAGNTTLHSTCRRVAPNVAAILRYSGSVRRKPASISSTVTIRLMASAMKMMARVPAPAMMMITGPSAIFGRLLSTTRYGSATRAMNGDHHSTTLTKRPMAAAPAQSPSASRTK